MVFPQITTLWLSYSNSSTLGSLPRRLPLMNAPELPHPNSSNWSYLSLGVSPRWMLSYCLTLITVLRVLSPNVSPRWMLNDYPTPIAVLRVLFSPRWMLNAYFLLGPTPIAVRQAWFRCVRFIEWLMTGAQRSGFDVFPCTRKRKPLRDLSECVRG